MCIVSVLMPVYNSDNYLEDAISSILSQTLSDFQFFIIDDGSTDNSWSIIECFANKDERIRAFKQENKGICATRNRLLGLAESDLIAWMDSDDIALPKRLETQLQLMMKQPELVASGSVCELIDEDGEIICEWSAGFSHEEIDNVHMSGAGGAIIFPASIMRRDAVLQAGGFDTSLTGAEDLSLFLKLAEVGKLLNSDKVLLQYRQHAKSISYVKTQQIKCDTYQVVNAAYQRRGMKPCSPMKNDVVPKLYQIYSKWAWWALRAGNNKVSKKYALKALVLRPFSTDVWRLMYCTLRGY